MTRPLLELADIIRAAGQRLIDRRSGRSPPMVSRPSRRAWRPRSAAGRKRWRAPASIRCRRITTSGASARKTTGIRSGCLAAVADAQSGARNLRHEEKFQVQLGLWNLVVVLILDLVNGEQAGFRLGIFGDHLVIGLRLLRTQTKRQPARCAGLSGGGGFGRGGRGLLSSQKEKRNQENENATGGSGHRTLLRCCMA